MSGFGNMISETVINGETSAASFLPGLKKYFARVLLASLLLIAFCIGFSSALSIIIIPITVLCVINGSINSLNVIIVLIEVVAVTLVIPFILLWLPSIFIDNAGVIQGLKNGVKAGVKNYWKLVLVIWMIYIPSAVNIVINFNTIMDGDIFTLGYLVMYILTAIITIVVLPMIFIIYKENK